MRVTFFVILFCFVDIKREPSKSEEKPERSTQAEYTSEQLQYVQR